MSIPSNFGETIVSEEINVTETTSPEQQQDSSEWVICEEEESKNDELKSLENLFGKTVDSLSPPQQNTDDTQVLDSTISGDEVENFNI